MNTKELSAHKSLERSKLKSFQQVAEKFLSLQRKPVYHEGMVAMVDFVLKKSIMEMTTGEDLKRRGWQNAFNEWLTAPVIAAKRSAALHVPRIRAYASEMPSTAPETLREALYSLKGESSEV